MTLGHPAASVSHYQERVVFIVLGCNLAMPSFVHKESYQCCIHTTHESKLASMYCRLWTVQNEFVCSLMNIMA